jgi:hypothetical protein
MNVMYCFVTGITYDQFRAADRNSPILLWPAFRVQERLQQLTLGVELRSRLLLSTFTIYHSNV